jgi:predicted molibdopterin-dependent oxidoreductase YjgC
MTLAGLAMAFGSGAMSNPMRDVAEHARAIFVIGSNTTEQHPVFGTMLRQAVLKRGAKLVVADPRAIDLAEFATLHLRQTPGTDVALLNGLMHIIVKNDWHDREFITQRTEGFEAFLPTLERYPPVTVARITGVAVAELERAAEILARSKPMAAVWAMRITQHTSGVLNVLALANLQMLLGNLGVPGGGVNPLRGQNNVQGACDMGALPNVFPGYQSVADTAAREKFARAWALSGEASLFGAEPGLTVTEIIGAAGQGRIRALYILGENPVMTDPDVNHVRACLGAAEFVVLQEIFPSETSHYGDVLLPGAAWAEKTGTFTNTERRVQLIREAVPLPGEARADWQIICDLAQRVLALEARAAASPHAGWEYSSPAAIMDEIAALTPSYAGVRHRRLGNGEQLFWPVPDGNHPGTPILHVGKFMRGQGKFHPCEHLPAAELPDKDYPLVLTTGHVLYHWHGGEMTRRSQGLAEVCPDARVEISPEDATRMNIADGSTVQLLSRRGEMLALAEVTERVAQGVVFGNFHFPGVRNVNNLTIAAVDPFARIPEYKVCAIRVEAA